MESSDNRFPFELALQRSILQTMLKSETFLLKCLMYVKEEYFDNKYLSWIFQSSVNYYNKYKALPELNTIKNEILKFDIQERLPYEKCFDDVINNKYKDEKYLYHELTGFCRRAFFLEQIKRISELYRVNRQNAYDLMKDVSLKLNEIDFEEDDIFNYANLMNLFESLRDVKYRCPLGISPIDRAMLGGVPKGRLCIFLAGTNVGKSMILVNVARNFIYNSKKVLYLSLENTEDDDLSRFMSCMTDIPIKKFSVEELSEDDKVKMIMSKEKMESSLAFKNFYDSNLTIDRVEAYCKMRYSISPYEAIIIDYAQMIKHRSSEKMRQDQVQGEVIIGLELLGRSLKVPVITAVQCTKAGLIKTQKSKGFSDLLRMTDVGESYAQMKHADIVVTVTRSDEDERKNTMRFLLDKNRGGIKGVLAECETDFIRGKVFTPDLRCRKIDWKDSEERTDEEKDDVDPCMDAVAKDIERVFNGIEF